MIVSCFRFFFCYAYVYLYIFLVGVFLYGGDLVYNTFNKALAVKEARVFLPAVAMFAVFFCSAS